MGGVWGSSGTGCARGNCEGPRRRERVLGGRRQDAPRLALWHGDVCHGSPLGIGDRCVPVRVHALLARADGKEGRLFGAWSNQRRVLIEACERVKIGRASLTSMRHAFAPMCKEGAVRQEDVAVAMGHADTSMLDRICARASTGRELVKRFEAAAAERRAALVLIEGGARKRSA